MTDYGRIVEKHSGVWSVYYRQQPPLVRSTVTKGYESFRDAIRVGAKLVMCVPTPEQANDRKTTIIKERVPNTTPERRLARRATLGPPSYLLRFVKEVHSLGPHLFYIEVFCQCWTVLESTLTIYTSNRLLETTSQYLEHGGSPNGIFKAMAFRLGLALFSEFGIKLL